jgi:hypothetical protein
VGDVEAESWFTMIGPPDGAYARRWRRNKAFVIYTDARDIATRSVCCDCRRRFCRAWVEHRDRGEIPQGHGLF